jgi:hypothetical protein
MDPVRSACASLSGLFILAVARAFSAISRAVMGSVVRRWIAGSSPAMTARGTGFCHPTGKSPGRFSAPPVQPLVKKYSDFPKTQISSYIRRPVPPRGVSRSSRARGGMRWPQAVLKTRALSCGRRRRVVLTPRRWRQVCGNSAGDGGKKARSPGRARYKP